MIDEGEIGILVRGLSIVVVAAEPAALPRRSTVSRYAAGDWIPVGSVDGRPCCAAPLADGDGLGAGLALTPLRALFDRLSLPVLDTVGRALALVEFEVMHRHCGRCGLPTEPVPRERAKRCPAGHGTFHPRIAPAVIILVTRGDEMLLARNGEWPAGRFSTVAGFVEPGESLEEAARREVHEEVGVNVDALTYFGSQPWPFGRSLMLGFFGAYAGGDIRVDGTEIAEADWFSATRLPPKLPPPVSIARRLIDTFLASR